MAKLPGAKYMPCGQRVVLFGNVEQVICPAEPAAGFYNLSEVDLPCVFCSRNKSLPVEPEATEEPEAPPLEFKVVEKGFLPPIVEELKAEMNPVAGATVYMAHTPPHGPSKHEKRRRK